MPAPGIITGSNNPANLFSPPEEVVSAPRGVFAVNPGATPKYALNAGTRDAEYRDTMARLFIEIEPDQLEALLLTIPDDVVELARVLLTGGPTGGAGGTGFIDFLLTNAQESLQEKSQVVETLTDTYVVFYSGQSSPVFSYSGTVLNTYQDDQRVWLFKLYRELLRGTRLANRGLFVNLRYDSFIVSGYLENLSMSLSGDSDMAGSFTFQLRVKRMRVITPILAYPTIAAGPASEVSLLEDASRLNAEIIARRPALIASPVPPTATELPGATPPSAPEPTTPPEAVAAAALEAEESRRIWMERATYARTQATTVGSFFDETRIAGLARLRDNDIINELIAENPNFADLNVRRQSVLILNALRQDVDLGNADDPRTRDARLLIREIEGGITSDTEEARQNAARARIYEADARRRANPTGTSTESTVLPEDPVNR